MAGNAFYIDEEGRALHQNWRVVLRVVTRVLGLSIVVWGVVRGLAVLVHEALHLVWHTMHHYGNAGWVMLFALLTAGGLLRGVLLTRFDFTDAAGDGMSVALQNYHSTYDDIADDPTPRFDQPTWSLAWKKALLTVITLCTGGSGGLESPVVTISEAIAAGWAKLTGCVSEFELRTLQLAAIAAAVSTLLGAPFAAALFAIEVVYGDKVVYRKLAYCLLAAMVGYVLNNTLYGAYHPIFEAPPHARTYTVFEYGMTTLVAVAVSAPLAYVFERVTASISSLTEYGSPILTSVLASLACGIIALSIYVLFGIEPEHVLGMSEDTLKTLLRAEPDSTLAVWWLLAIALFAKMLTTGFTIQSGGSAGLLIPSMYMGGVSGAIVALLMQSLGFPLDVPLFVVVGIASSLVAVVGVPMAAIVLVLEVFGAAYGPPAILACGVTYVLTLRLRTRREFKRRVRREGEE